MFNCQKPSTMNHHDLMILRYFNIQGWDGFSVDKNLDDFNPTRWWLCGGRSVQMLRMVNKTTVFNKFLRHHGLENRVQTRSKKNVTSGGRRPARVYQEQVICMVQNDEGTQSRWGPTSCSTANIYDLGNKEEIGEEAYEHLGLQKQLRNQTHE